ncbi:DUF6286 domain-containing protein [Frondihabitans sp. VKM Ac-2883]|uniref:DUF6286 domain-containing protein n=1 Tax=Frondihabitans sp. VKM Ac-2883 TaxID=2783823 RepID=UPI00188A0C2A|nr:DUF6286 domain-containing protein [Frondihabitans sp. VKM Ac-2883]MBF4575342.1 hypothetical protein [Frondihabitans sp. VKM Ac-2883]
MTSPAIYRRVVRRETHSSRSGIAITLAVLLIVVFAWFGVESVLAAIGQPALLVSPKDAAVAVLGAVSGPVGLLTAGGAVVAVIGLVLIVVSLAPGRKGRRGSVSERTASVVDDRVIAQSVAQTGAYAGDIDPDQVKVTVGKRTVDVDVTPTSGRTADVHSIEEAVNYELKSYDYSPSLRSRVRVSEKGTLS